MFYFERSEDEGSEVRSQKPPKGGVGFAWKNYPPVIPADGRVFFETSKENQLGPSVCLSVDKKVHTCIIREHLKNCVKTS
jgi:hypothetical protein